MICSEKLTRNDALSMAHGLWNQNELGKCITTQELHYFGTVFAFAFALSPKWRPS